MEVNANCNSIDERERENVADLGARDSRRCVGWGFS